MAKFSFNCPQCGEKVDADDSLRGQVAECPYCGKGIVVPRSIMVRPTSSAQVPLMNNNIIPMSPPPQDFTRGPNEFERKIERAAERHRQKQKHEIIMMLTKVTVAIVIVAGGLIWWNKIKKDELAQQRVKLAAEQAETERIEQEKKRLEQEERDKEAAAVKALQTYLDREKARLKDVIEEAKINHEACDIDQKELAEELDRIEKENAKLANASRLRKQKRYDKAEHVLLLLKSSVLSSIYEKYLGENLAAIRAKYENEVKTVIKLHRETESRLRQNKNKYFETVKGINEEVDQKNEAAVRRAKSAKYQTDKQLHRLREKKQQLEKRLLDEQNKRVIVANTSISGRIRETNGAKNRRQRMADLAGEIERLDREIATAEALASGNQAQMVHLEATTAETAARRKFDTAIEVRQSADNDVHADARHQSDVFHIAARYEKDTLDTLRQAIQENRQVQELRVAEAKRKLEFINRSTINLDLMKVNEIEAVRSKIVAELSEEITGNKDEKKRPDDE